jgi:FkbM family methyltransferase
MIRALPPERKARIIGNLPFVGNAKFHPKIRCYVSNDVEYARSQRVLSAESHEWIYGFNEGDIFYDVGANIGMFSLFTAKHWQGNVKVLAFEPSFSTYASLVRNVAINGLENIISCFQIALGESTHLGNFNYSSLEAGAALHSLDTKLNFRREVFTPVFQHPVLSYALNDIIREFDLPLPTHMKIDVDGTELEILRGAEQILNGHPMRSVMIEIVDIRENDERTAAITQFFSRLGYECHAKFLHGNSLKFPRISDYVFVKS